MVMVGMVGINQAAVRGFSTNSKLAQLLSPQTSPNISHLITMKVTRTIPALEDILGLNIAPSELLEIIQTHMRRRLSPQERDVYRGITRTGAPWNVFSKLCNVETTEDFIVAQETGAFLMPADRPGEVYLFACGKGVIASVEWTCIRTDPPGELKAPASEESFHELNTKYRLMPIDEKDWETVFQEVAQDFASWIYGRNGQQVEV